MTFSTVLVPIDFTDNCFAAYQHASDFFASTDRTLILLHALEGRVDLSSAGDTAQRNDLEEKKRQLTTMGNRRRSDWKDVLTLIESGKPAEMIIRTSKQMAVDLVVMGSGSTSGLVKGLFGNTTYDVARKVKCSVFFCKSDKNE